MVLIRTSWPGPQRLTSALLLLLTSLCAFTHGWFRDDTCDDIAPQLQAGMKGAFELADAARKLLTALEEPSDYDNRTPKRVAQEDLVSYIFYRLINDDNEFATDDPEWAGVKKRFDWIYKQSKERLDGSPQPQPRPQPFDDDRADGREFKYGALDYDDSVIYCQYDGHFKDEDEDSDSAEDLTVFINWQKTDIYLGCRDTQNVLAWTGSLNTHNDVLPAQIQLCNHVYEKIKKDTTDRERLIERFDPMAMLLEVLPLMNKPKKIIDFTIDLILVHELSHAIPADGTDDSQGDQSYGWDNVVRISQEGDTSLKNADSYAWFAAGAWLIEHNLRFVPDGKIQVIPDDEDDGDDEDDEDDDMEDPDEDDDMEDPDDDMGIDQER